MLGSESLLVDGGVRSDVQELTSKHYYLGSDDFKFHRSLSVNEEEKSSDLFEIDLGLDVQSNRKLEDDCEESWFSFDFRKSNHCVYVGIGDNAASSMAALQWTLDFAVLPSSIVYLLHVSPEIRFVPSPLGMLPRSQVGPKIVEKFMAEERAKRREFLHKFVDTCSSAQVNVEVVMIESDMVAKAILDLISLLQIRKLILGRNSTKARKWRSKREGIAKQILKNAEEFCDVKIICEEEGKESTCQVIDSSSSSSSSCSSSCSTNFKIMKKEHRRSEFVSWRCFGG
ncbi:U-box domain-containing protein 35-like [Cucurbita pepo subsp. pepo]|uniref:U-box domain-containing protein 35-like n=1 Tax=Cucurbita pepo subsp. pepo TaxID=3664 RepID=UPI000C9D8314|nr:U-box domain-containing protein 35-like [Cucurbita pepo subsp. pepo]